jgi:RNAse (barnase) inhibitor barstar
MTLPVSRVDHPDWSCVHFAREGPSEEDLTDRGIALVLIEGDRVTDGGELMDALAVGFSFPDYFGRNWDAVDECLRDLSWLPGDGYTLVVRGAERLWSREPRLAGRLVESWLFSAEHWARLEKPFHLVFEW